MRVEREKLGDWFIYGREVAWKYSLTSVGRPAARFADLGLTIDGGMSLDWGGHYFGPPVLKQRLVETQGYDLAPGAAVPRQRHLRGELRGGDGAGREGRRGRPRGARPGPRWACCAGRSARTSRSCGSARRTAGSRIRTSCAGWSPTAPSSCSSTIRTTRRAPCSRMTTWTPSSAVARRHGTYLLSDEIYRGLEWDGPVSPSAVNAYERGIVTSSLTKTLGMCGLRLGWVGSRDKEFLDRAFALHRYGVMVNDVFGEQPRRRGARAGDLGPPPGGGEADRPPQPAARDRLDGAELALQLGRPRRARSPRFPASSCR